MGAAGSHAGKSWAGWVVVITFGFLFLYVRVTGHGLGDLPSASAAWQLPVPVSGGDTPGTSPVPISDPVGGSPDWLTGELQRLGVLAADETLLLALSEAWPECTLVIVGPGDVYRGRICESSEGLYRVNADGLDTGLRWRLDEAGQWKVTVHQGLLASG